MDNSGKSTNFLRSGDQKFSVFLLLLIFLVMAVLSESYPVYARIPATKRSNRVAKIGEISKEADGSEESKNPTPSDSPASQSSEPGLGETPLKKILTLDDCIKVAMEYHPELKSSLALREAARARVTVASSANLPRVAAQTSYNHSDSNGGIDVISGTNNNSQYATSFSLGQNIYDFGRTKYRVMSARENLHASSYDVLSTADKIIFDIQQAYFRSVAADRTVKVNREAVETRQLHLNQARGFYNIGTRPRIEVTKAEVDLANAELALIHSESTARLARVNLANAIGQPGSVDDSLDGSIRLAEIEMSLDEAIVYARDHRPEVLKLGVLERQRLALLDVARAERYPSIAGTGSYNWRDNNLAFNRNQWNVGVQVQYDIFNGHRREAEIKEAEENLEAQRYRNERSWQAIYLEVQQAYLNLQDARSRLVMLETTLVSARESFQLAQGRYEAGVGTNLEFADAQLALQRAQLDLNSAILDYQVAQARVEHVTGLSVVSRSLGELFSSPGYNNSRSETTQE